MPEQRDLAPQLQGRLTYLLKHARAELSRLHQQHLAPEGIDVRELTMLMSLDGREPESQQEAGGRLGIDRTTMVALLDSLEGKGLVVREADPRDRRRNVIAVTDAGRAVLVRATRASDDAERELLAGLDEEDAAQLRALLRRMADGSSERGRRPG